MTKENGNGDARETEKKPKLKFPPEPLIILGIVAFLPIFIPTAVGILVWTELQERRKRCLRCGNQRLILVASDPVRVPDRSERYSSRRPIPWSYYECDGCHAHWRSRWGEPLLDASDIDFAQLPKLS